MAEEDSKPTQPQLTQEEEQRLKYLEFVQVAAFHLVGCFSSIYDYAKENSGPLKPGVRTVEGTVKNVIGPVYDKFHDVPFEFLKFVDRKVDVSVNQIGRQVPPIVKERSSQVLSVAQRAPEVARAVASEVQRAGVVGSATVMAKNVYTSYEPVAEQYAVTTWHKLNQLPLFPQVAHIVVPTAAYWTDKYNKAVCYTSDRGYTVSSYLPLVPTEKIAKVFGAKTAPTIGGEAVVAQSGMVAV
ncbi:hypothetical protein GIB67_023028 [Kingdonia uniflora]|uniref:Stress-related protein n=1 Tax=Kingdonia uniflora TaxID=39325 RepID=A0A7J7P2J2_9MAGN|nr:hypothetical protein GIB67_023028 [Kingdonia uniflora]